MAMEGFLGSPLFNLVCVPILIFCARIVDVSVGTLRIMFVSRGVRVLASVLGFFEVLIWLVAISQIIQNLTSPIHYAAYAAGFATGNYVGISIERKLSFGNIILRIVTKKDAAGLINFLGAAGYGVTSVNAEGTTGPVKIVFTVMKRKDLPDAVGMLKDFDANAFYTVEDVRYVTEKNVVFEDRRKS